MTGIPRNVAGRLAGLFKRKAKEVVEETVEEAIEEVIEGVKEEVKKELSDVYGVYTIQGRSHGLPRRVYSDGVIRIGKMVIQPGRKT